MSQTTAAGDEWNQAGEAPSFASPELYKEDRSVWNGNLSPGEASIVDRVGSLLALQEATQLL